MPPQPPRRPPDNDPSAARNPTNTIRGQRSRLQLPRAPIQEWTEDQLRRFTAAEPQEMPDPYELPIDEAGQLVYHDGRDSIPLDIGSTGQVLTVAGGLPTWATPSVTAAADIADSNWTLDWDGSGGDPAIGDGTKTAYNMQVFYNQSPFEPALVHGQVRLEFGSTTTFGTGDWDFSLPFFPVYLQQDGDVIGNGAYIAGGTWVPVFVVILGTSEVQLRDPSGAVVGSATEAWAEGDIITFNLIQYVGGGE